LKVLSAVASVPHDERAAVPERDEYPPGVPCWVDTEQPDAQAAAAFYGALFGWEFEDRMPAGAPGNYFVARLRGLDVAAVSSPMDASAPARWNTYLAVASADIAAGRVEEAGGTVVMPPFDVPGAGRMGVVTDTSGATFSVWQPGENKGAQLVNEADTWSFNTLNTRDPETAKRFYQAVFGWGAETFAMGESSFTIFYLPGYADFLERSNPDLRRELADAGAPPRYADAVALLVTMTDEQFPAEVPSHWGVTFAVDDADATAARATQLGGTVTVPPFDAEPVRLTVLADPQGAILTASRFQPSL
jgi:predicted enzyme related to lactoylglutathione lyase